MTAHQIKQAAELAILAMSDADKSAFIDMVDAGDNLASDVAKSFAVEGTNRQVTMAHMALENSGIMRALTELTYDRMAEGK